jgi:hypothetical protein
MVWVMWKHYVTAAPYLKEGICPTEAQGKTCPACEATDKFLDKQIKKDLAMQVIKNYPSPFFKSQVAMPNLEYSGLELKVLESMGLTVKTSTDFRDNLQVVEQPTPEGFRLFKGFSFCSKDFNLSIQASKAHYCSPKATLEDLKAYISWEICFTGKDKKEQKAVVGLLGLEGSDGEVFAHVPTAKVQELYSLLCRFEKEPWIRTNLLAE